MYGQRNYGEQTGRVGIVIATTNSDGGVAHVIYADSRSPLYTVPQSFFQPSKKRLRGASNLSQIRKMSESPFSVGSAVEFAPQDESATRSIAVKWVARGNGESRLVTFHDGIPHIFLDAVSSGDALWIHYGQLVRKAGDGDDAEALAALPVDTPLRAKLAIELGELPVIPRLETFRPAFKLRLVSGEVLHGNVTLEALIRNAVSDSSVRRPLPSAPFHRLCVGVSAVEAGRGWCDLRGPAERTRRCHGDDGERLEFRKSSAADSLPILTQAVDDYHRHMVLPHDRAMYLDEHLKDCTVQVIRDGVGFRAHKLLLARCSVRFYKSFVEEGAEVVTIEDYSSQAVRTLLDTIYGRRIDVAAMDECAMDECAMDVLSLASEHGLDALKTLAASRLLLQLQPGNVLRVARLAHDNNVPELKKACAKLLDENRQMIYETPEWRELLTKNENEKRKKRRTGRRPPRAVLTRSLGNFACFGGINGVVASF